MDSDLKAVQTRDVDLIWSIVFQPDLWETVAEDNPPTFKPDVINEAWVLITNDGEPIGCYNLHSLNNVTWEIHAFILPAHREHAKESGRLILRWSLNNINFHKLQAVIPAMYPNVYHFTLHQGFTDEGLSRKSYMKNNQLHDQHILGITRDEVEVLFNE